MAMIVCPECKSSISDKAAACPHCGAPNALAAPSLGPAPTTPGKRKTHPVTWMALILIVLAAVWYFPKAEREANLPAMPVTVKYRSALLGPGLVLAVTNTSTRHLSLVVALTNPSTRQEKTYRLDVGPKRTVEVGHAEGWILESGDEINITHNDYQAWQGSIP